MGDFKDGWNTFVVSVPNHTLAWHLNKFTGKVKFDVEFENSVAYYMSDHTGKAVRNVNESSKWGNVTGNENLIVGIPYWIYLSGVAASNAVNFNAFPVGWDIYYPETTIETDYNINSQWASYGDLYGSQNLPYLKLSRSAVTNSGYFFELAQGDAFFSNKLHIGKVASGYPSVSTSNIGNGEFKCYVTQNNYLEIVKDPTGITNGVTNNTINLNLYDISGNNNNQKTSSLNFFNKFNNSDTQTDQNLGTIEFYGYKNNTYISGGSIKVVQEAVDQSAGDPDSLPTKMDFEISNKDNNINETVMSISSDNDKKVHVKGALFAEILRIPVVDFGTTQNTIDSLKKEGSIVFSLGVIGIPNKSGSTGHNPADASGNPQPGDSGLYIYLNVGGDEDNDWFKLSL